MNSYQAARAALEKKQLGVAERGLLAVLKTSPDHVEANRDLGVLRFLQRRFDDAERAVLKAIAIDPSAVDSHLQLAEMYTALKRDDDAVARLEMACEADVGSSRAWVTLGHAYERQGKGPDHVLMRMHECSLSHPDSKALLMLLGNMRANRGQHQAAFAAFDRAALAYPRDAEAQLHRANALYFCDRYDEALAGYQTTLELEPGMYFAWSQTGNVYLRLRRSNDAIEAFSKALAIEKTSYDALVGMGAALWEQDRFEEALTFLQGALHVNPRGTAAFNNIGQVMVALKDDANAIAMFDRVREIDPNADPEADLSAATCRLRMGNYEAGWTAYERRHRIDRHPIVAPGRYAGAQRWNGESIAGKTLLIAAEQGAGDTFQFARYVPLAVRASGARVVFAVQAPAVPLLIEKQADWGPQGQLSIVSAEGPLPQVDYFVPLMSLPLVFRTRVDSIPSAPSYLSVPERYRQKWRVALPERGRLRFGLVWCGNPKHTNDRNRSMPIQHLAPLVSDKSVDWCVLQPGVSASDAQALATVPHVFNAGPHLKDFADTAAIIELLDVVITVDTSVAHIAGALGKPVFLLLPWAAEWRWFHDRNDSPWYPTARLFRQPAIGDWDAVIEAVQHALIEHAKQKAGLVASASLELRTQSRPDALVAAV